MKLLQSLSSITALTSCVIVIFLFRKKFKFFKQHKNQTPEASLKEEKNEIQKDDSEQQNNLKIPILPNPNWVKIGRVQKLYMYPLNMGVGKFYSTLKFTDHGIISENKGLIVWDRMFQIFDKQTKQFQSGHELENISLININVVNKFKVRFCAIGMSNLTIDLKPKETQNILSELKTDHIVVRYVDCGDVAADWINIFLRKSTLRLIRAEYDIIDEPTNSVNEDLLKNEIDNKAWELFMSLTRYVVITSKSLKKLEMEIPIRFSTIQPNIIISTLSFPIFAEEEDWRRREWMKFGNVIMRRIMPVSSWKNCQQSLQNNNDIDANDNDYNKKLPFMGNFYRLYTIGDININDDVFIHV